MADEPVKTEVVDDKPSAQPDTAKPTSEAPENSLPEKLRGKSSQEIASMYLSLEQKLGEQSGEVEKARKARQDLDFFVQAVSSDPELFKSVKKAVEQRAGVTIKEEESSKKNDQPTKRDDVRAATQNRIIEDFARDMGITQMPTEKQSEVLQKVGTELADLVDPSGTKSVSQVLSEVPLDRLHLLLEKAFWLANKDSIISGDSNRFSAIGNLSHKGGEKSDDNALTEEEKVVARKLGISEEKYAKQKSKKK